MGYMFDIWHQVFLNCETDISKDLEGLGPVCFTWNNGQVKPEDWKFDAPLRDFTAQLNEMRKLGVRGNITVVGEVGDHTKYSITGFSVQSVCGWVKYWSIKEYKMPRTLWRILIHKDGQRGSVYRMFFKICDWRVDGDEILFTDEYEPVPGYVKRKVKQLSKLARAWAEIPKILP